MATCIQLIENHAYEIDLPHADPAGGDQRIAAPHTRVHRCGEGTTVVGYPTQVNGIEPLPGEQRQQHRPVCVTNLARRKRPRCGHELVAGGEHPDAGPGVHEHRGSAGPRQHTEPGGVQHHRPTHHLIPPLHVLSGAAHVRTNIHRLKHPDDPVVTATRRRVPRPGGGLLHGNDGVDACGHGGTGHDPGTLTRADRQVTRVPCENRGHHHQRHWGVGSGRPHVVGTHGVPVHGAVVERRDRTGGTDRLGGHTPVGDAERPTHR
jgi:hypothetical protein